MGLCFTSNSLRFLGIRRQVFNVWEPAALVRRNEDDETASDSGKTYVTGFSMSGQVGLIADTSPITAIAEHHTGDYIFVAKENGMVGLYETNGRPNQKLFEYGRTFVTQLAWNEGKSLLACGDSSTNVKVYQVIFMQERGPGGATRMICTAKELMRRTLTQPIRQVILSLDGELLLVTTSVKEYVFRTDGGAPMLVNDNIPHLSIAKQAQKWATYSRTKYQFLEVYQGSQVITWDRDNPRPRAEPVPGFQEPSPELTKRTNAYLVRVGTKLWSAHDNNQFTAPIVWPQSTTLQSEQAATKIAAHALREFDKIGAKVDSIIGLHRTKMIFISTDHWICSVRIDKIKFEDPIMRHFPMPHAWRASNRPLQVLVTCRGDIVVAVEGDLVVVKNGL